MKKLIVLSILLLMCAVTTAKSNHKDPFHFTIEGKFLHQKGIVCTIYKMDAEGTFKVEDRIKVNKYFYLSCNVGDKYIVRFEDKNHNSKFLMIDASTSGYFELDIDFSKPYDAKLHNTKNGYSLLPLTNGAMAQK